MSHPRRPPTEPIQKRVFNRLVGHLAARKPTDPNGSQRKRTGANGSERDVTQNDHELIEKRVFESARAGVGAIDPKVTQVTRQTFDLTQTVFT